MASSLLDVSTFNTWIQAQSDGDTELANLYLRRYSPEFRVGFGGAIEREEEPDEVQHRHPCVDGQAHPGYHEADQEPDERRADLIERLPERLVRRRGPAPGPPAPAGVRTMAKTPSLRASTRVGFLSRSWRLTSGSWSMALPPCSRLQQVSTARGSSSLVSAELHESGEPPMPPHRITSTETSLKGGGRACDGPCHGRSWPWG